MDNHGYGRFTTIGDDLYVFVFMGINNYYKTKDDFDCLLGEESYTISVYDLNGENHYVVKFKDEATYLMAKFQYDLL